jgi:hypothetical protein
LGACLLLKAGGRVVVKGHKQWTKQNLLIARRLDRNVQSKTMDALRSVLSMSVSFVLLLPYASIHLLIEFPTPFSQSELCSHRRVQICIWPTLWRGESRCVQVHPELFRRKFRFPPSMAVASGRPAQMFVHFFVHLWQCHQSSSIRSERDSKGFALDFEVARMRPRTIE